MQAPLLKVSALLHFANTISGKFCSKPKIWESNSSATLDPQRAPLSAPTPGIPPGKGDMERKKKIIVLGFVSTGQTGNTPSHVVMNSRTIIATSAGKGRTHVRTQQTLQHNSSLQSVICATQSLSAECHLR